MTSVRLTGYLFSLILIVCLLPPALHTAPTPDGYDHNTSHVYSPLVEKLENDGFPRDYLEAIYITPETKFYERLTRINLLHREKADPYAKMRNADAVHAIREFLTAHEETFRQMKERYPVDPGVIAAILYVESRFGKAAGDHPVLYALSSMTLAPEDWSIRALIDRMDSVFPDLTAMERERKITWIQDRAASKASWAYDELTTLLKLRESHDLDVQSLEGSWAGAFGIPQFLPSSYAAYAVDGNGDGRIDLYTMKDAIMSVANYLYENGWRSGNINQEKKRRTIWSYNHSSYYVDLITYLAGEAAGS